MANVKKLTKKDKFNALLSIAEVKSNADLVEFINHEIELLDKKNSSEKKPTAQQTANEAIKAAILDNMVEGKRYTITDLIKTIPECADLTNQRVSALIRQLVDDKVVVRTEDKRKAYFSLAETPIGESLKNSPLSKKNFQKGVDKSPQM
jgi:predicted transcriptional regulator